MPKITIERETLIDLIAQHLRDTYHCTRVWRAWQVGTMGEDDFCPVDESDTPVEIADAVLAALAAQPAEPNMRHPKIQALIGGKARAEIELGLVEQLLEDPNFETTYTHAEVRKMLDGISGDAALHGLEVVDNLDGTMGLRAALAQKAEPVAWVDDLSRPQPHCVTNLKYMSAYDVAAGVKYQPVYAAPPAPAAVPQDEKISAPRP